MFGLKSIVANSFKRTIGIPARLDTLSFSTFTQPLCIQLTQIALAQPMKRKKKVDPAILRVREERKRRKLWKECKRLMKFQKQLKPLDETEIPYVLVDDRENHLRPKPPLSVETLEHRSDTMKAWTTYRNQRSFQDYKMIDSMLRAREKALYELKVESPRLYEEALKCEPSLLPYTAEGPTLTPPIKDYESPDGEYVDVSRKWEPVKLPEVPKKKWDPKKKEESSN